MQPVKTTRLAEIGEDELISSLTAELRMDDSVLCGPGDDCAVLTGSHPDYLDLLKTDAVVEGVHFVKEEQAEAVGWKAVARAVSDIAAMGGLPTAAVVTLVAPETLEVATVVGWYRGMQRAADAFGFSIVGGETSSIANSQAMISVAMTGRVEPDRCVYRSGAQLGDAILVTGQLGGSLASGRHLHFQPRLAEARWLTEHFRLHSMMDLSDGLAKDLPRMMRASGTGYRIDEKNLPCHNNVNIQSALTDGEDYELLFTIAADEVDKLQREWLQSFANQVQLSVIGQVIEKTKTQLQGGWEHFSKTKH
ncbi:MAG: thiamine-phosphate kinase [Verrucomicrobiales bacterium]|nr:thiamine-phosphate kinase [Verrucomicrobiales bacterium]